MKYRAGFLKALCAWVVILMHGLDAGHAPKKHAAGVSCRLKELTALAQSLVRESLASFCHSVNLRCSLQRVGSFSSQDEANGKHLGTWPAGFPELQVHQDSPFNASKVQCSLLFMAQGLENVLHDQKNNLNPGDVSLHKKLRDTIATVNMLGACVKDALGGECSPNPSPPTMPHSTFERKQWSHTLLKIGRDYLIWLESKVGVHISKVKEKSKIRRRVTEATRQRYVEGAGYLL